MGFLEPVRAWPLTWRLATVLTMMWWFGDARPADGSRTAVERRFAQSDTNRNAALKSMGEEGNA